MTVPVTREGVAATVGTEHDVRLRDNSVPELEAGDYTITLTHDLTAGGHSITDTPLTARRQVRVETPAVSLDPSLVFAVYPPPGGSGNFAAVLPHITLTDPSLPWTRSLRGGHATLTNSQDPPVPWMALLLVTDDDVVDPEHLATSATVGHLTAPAGTGTRPDPAPDPSTPCQVLELTTTAAGELLPHTLPGDLATRAHVREVIDSATARDDDRFAPGAYSVVFTDRLALPGPNRTARSYTAALVSLEGYTYRADAPSARLAVLYSWRFTTTLDTTASFHTLALGLAQNARPDPMLALRPRTALSDPGPGETVVRARLREGFIPVTHRTPDGTPSLGWYRGPLTPVLAPTPAPPPADPTAWASWPVYSCEFGVFDLGYSAAHTLGHLSVLTRPDRTTALRTLRARAAEAAARALTPSGSGVDAFETLITTQGFVTDLTNNLKKLTNKPPSRDSHPPRTRSGPDPGRVRAALRAMTAPDPRDRATDPDVARVLKAIDGVLDTATRALGQSGLTADRMWHEVPFEHLVPDIDMLPGESVRFFHIDPAWTGAWLAGATGTGAATVLDRHLGHVLTGRLDGAEWVPRCGMLLRSAMVRHWPTLAVTATTGPAPAETPVGLLARRPAPDVLMVVWDRIPDTVTVAEPPHALRLGLDAPLTESGGALDLRAPQKDFDDKHPIGQVVGTLRPVDTYLRQGLTGSRARAVLNCADLLAAITQTLSATKKVDPAATGSAGLALQLINTREKLVFTRSQTRTLQ
jgi:hypothetical protein